MSTGLDGIINEESPIELSLQAESCFNLEREQGTFRCLEIFRYEFGVPTQNRDIVTPSCVHQNFGLNCVTKETRLLLSFFLSLFSFEGVPVGVPGAIFKRLGSIEVFFVKVLASAMIQSLRHLSQLCVWLYLTSYSQTFVPYVPIRSSFQK